MSRLILNEGAAPSAPSAGKDAVYMSSETLPRLRRKDGAGTEWVSADVFLACLASDYTLANVNTAQAAFNVPTNGAITLPGSSSYLLEASYTITNTGITSHTWGVLFGGTATLTSGRYTAIALSNTTNAIGAAQIGHTTTLGTAFTVTAASTSATENVNIIINGAVRINAGGTFIPQVQLSAATGTAAVMKANSWVRLTPFGSNTATTLGAWT